MSTALFDVNQTGEETDAARPIKAAAAALSLDSLPAGVEARVLAVGGSGPVARRLMEMGVVPGVPVRVIKAAPLGDPLEVRVRSYHLALRRSEARTISVLPGEDTGATPRK